MKYTDISHIIDVGERTLTFKVEKHSIMFAQSPRKKDSMWPVTCNVISEKKSYFVLSDMPTLVPVPIPVVTPPPQIVSKLEDNSFVLDIAGNGLEKEESFIAPAVKEPIVQRGGLGCLSYGTDEESDEEPKKVPVRVTVSDLELETDEDVQVWEDASDVDPSDNVVDWSAKRLSTVEGTSCSQKPWSKIFRIFRG
ncbi:uncharacterized protein LOC141610550 [Silene latifolia]|uniref:uncharacterized protein LOC141610550 n=1 Tax=Silene latifolia TaxID=37657 RepID=UPI003D7728BE